MNLIMLLEMLNKDWAEKERQRRLRSMARPGEPSDSEGYTLQMQLQQMFPELSKFQRQPMQQQSAQPMYIPRSAPRNPMDIGSI